MVLRVNRTCLGGRFWSLLGFLMLLVLRVNLGEGRVEYACSCSCSFGTISINRLCSIFPPHHQGVGDVCCEWSTGWQQSPSRQSLLLLPPMGLSLVAASLWLPLRQLQSLLLWDRFVPWEWHQNVHCFHFPVGVADAAVFLRVLV